MAYGAYDQYADTHYVVPDIVKQFVIYLYRHIRERNIPEIHSMYELTFAKLSDRYFKQSPWPPVEYISDLVDQDHVFCLLYKELYYRHLYAKCQPNLRQRCESWDNYCELFGVILHGNVNMQLPNIWLWDMIDEFIYQFQSFCQYRGKVAMKTSEELELLKQCDKVWHVLDVLNVLQALVDKSGIAAELSADGGVELLHSDGYLPNQSNVLRMLAYFSLTGLLRVHCLIGDYHTGLRALYPLNLFEPRHLFTQKIALCHITLYYYASFAYIMMRRYIDAARCLNTILSFVARVKQYHERSAGYDQILKKNEQMYALLAVSAALCPAAAKLLDENVATALRDKHADPMARMARGALEAFDQAFTYACPKFITPAPPQYDNPSVNTFQEAFRAQLRLFMAEVSTQKDLPDLKQYLILYSSVTLSKLAGLLDRDVPSLRSTLMCLKAKTHALRYEGGSDMTAGVMAPATDIDFYIDVDENTGQEMVIVSDRVRTRHQVDVLARYISKFEAIIHDLELPAAKAAQPAY